MKRASTGPLFLGGAAMLLGAPAYLALLCFARPPAWLVDRPWPLATFALAALLVCVLGLLRGRAGGRRALAAIAALGTAASLAGLYFVSRRGMPEPSPEVALGRALPDVTLTDETGRGVALSSLRGHATVLVFYRGGLCVACRAQLSALARHADPFIAAGVRVFGVSADPPNLSLEWKKTLSLPFSLLTDDHQGVVQALCNARAHCLVLVDPDGVVRWGALNDYWRGAEPAEAVLLAAYRLAASPGAVRGS